MYQLLLYFPLSGRYVACRVVILSGKCSFRGLHSIKELSPARYESFIKDDPPMDIDTVMKSMRDFVEYVLLLLNIHIFVFL